MRKTLAVLGLVALAGCGGSDTPVTPSTPPPAPNAAISGTGAGLLVLHPSAAAAWAVALEVPVQVAETAGGTATWNYARLALWLDGVEVERAEIGADILMAPPDVTQIGARSSQVVDLIYRINSSEFDEVRVTLGFSDKKDGRQFVEAVPFDSFTGIDISIIPLARPAPSAHRLD